MINLTELWHLYRDQVDGAIGGWFYEHDIVTFWLIDYTHKVYQCSGDLCELGVYKGKTAIGLGRMAQPDEVLFCYDFFGECSIDDVRANISRFCPDLDRRLVLIKRNLRELKAPPSEIAPGSLRLLHLDAVHDHPSVFNDLNNFAPLMAPHGVLVLDDYFDPNWPGVSTAMTEFCLSDQGRNFRPFASSKSKMYLCRREWVDIYQKSIIESGVIAHLAFELVLDGSVLRCYTNWPASREALLGHFDRKTGG